jgi:catechol 2,3-dioxygenase-like lactoylglutathione lyase family enzyme
MNQKPHFPRMHVSLYVSNLASTINFYTTFFGVAASKVKSGYAKYELNNPGLIISFVENKARVQHNFGHLGIQVASQDELYSRMTEIKAKGLKLTEEIATNCCYAVQDKFWVEDPDGIQWEVYYFHKDVEFNDPKYAHSDSEICCVPTEKNEKRRINLKDMDKVACDPKTGCC